MFDRFTQIKTECIAHHFQPWPFLKNSDNSFPDNQQRRFEPAYCRAITFPKFRRKKQGKYFDDVSESNSKASTIQPSAFNMQVVAMPGELNAPNYRGSVRCPHARSFA